MIADVPHYITLESTHYTTSQSNRYIIMHNFANGLGKSSFTWQE